MRLVAVLLLAASWTASSTDLAHTAGRARKHHTHVDPAEPAQGKLGKLAAKAKASKTDKVATKLPLSKLVSMAKVTDDSHGSDNSDIAPVAAKSVIRDYQADYSFEDMYGGDFNQKEEEALAKEVQELEVEKRTADDDIKQFGEFPPDNIHWSRNHEAGIARTGFNDYYQTIQGEAKPVQDFTARDAHMQELHRIEQRGSDNIHWARNKHSDVARTGFNDYNVQGAGFDIDMANMDITGVPISNIDIMLPHVVEVHKNFHGYGKHGKQGKSGQFIMTKGVPMQPLERWTIIHGLSPFVFSVVEPETSEYEDHGCKGGLEHLPWGLSINAHTGTIDGTPLVPFRGCVLVQIEEKREFYGKDRRATILLVIDVADVLTTQADNPRSFQQFQQNEEAHTAALEVNGGQTPFKFSTTSRLPDGLKLDPLFGEISGTPTETWDEEILIDVTDAVGAKSTRSIRLVVHAECYINPAQFVAAKMILNADIDTCNHANEAACQPICQKGYEGATPWQCNADGSWTSAPCTPIPCTGYVPFEALHYVRQDTSSCDTAPDAACHLTPEDGYENPHPLKCLDSGKWSYKATTPVMCLGTIPYAQAHIVPLLNNQGCDTAPAGVCQVFPEAGYEGGGPLDCGNDGEWILPVATAIPCNDPIDFAANFIVSISTEKCDTAPEDVCPTTALLGYKNPTPLNCTNSGDWEFKPAEPIYCTVQSASKAVLDGHFVSVGFEIKPAIPCFYVPQGKCDISCQPGYEFPANGGIPQMSCEMASDTKKTGNGKWVIDRCIPIKAQGPPDFAGYNLEPVDYDACDEAPEPLCATTCIKGFERKAGAPTFQVNNDGLWSYAGCIETKCPAPPTIPNSDPWDSTKCDTANLPACTITCATNYKVAGQPPQADCNKFGQWTTSSGCIPVTCSGPNFSSMQVKPVTDLSACDTAPAGTCQMTCNDGYETSGANTLKCKDTGNYEFSDMCTPIKCKDPADWDAFFAAGFVETVATPFLDVCNHSPDIGCPTRPLLGYENAKPLVCDNNGDWQLTPADPIQCTGTPDFQTANIQAIVDYTACDTAPEPKCDTQPETGYEGGGPLNCNNAGVWELPAATPVVCTAEPDWDGSNIAMMGISACNTAVSQSCNTKPKAGYYGGGPLTCQADGTWDLPAADPIKCTGIIFWQANFVKPLASTKSCETSPSSACDVDPADGYMFEKGVGKLNCNNQGVWELDKAIPTVCRNPIRWTDAHIKAVSDIRPCDTIPEGTCKTVPEDGYSGGGPLSCGAGGTWSLPPATALKCTGSPDAASANIVLPASLDACDTVAEPACQVSCATDYEMKNGYPEINCSYSGGKMQWTTDACTPVKCQGAPDFASSKIVPVAYDACDTAPSGACTSTCEEGFKTANGQPPSVDCGSLGSWTVNSCMDVQCAGLPNIPNTQPFQVKDVCDRSGDLACKPSCVSGADGAPSIDCLTDGTYSVVGGCDAKVCPGIPDFASANAAFSSINQCDNALKGSCNLKCAPGYAGDIDLKCGDDRSWKFTPVGSGCQAVQCPADYRVNDNVCIKCLAGQTHPSTSALSADTSCTRTFCANDYRVLNHQCAKCGPGETTIGNYADGPDTACTVVKCKQNFYVNKNVCTACAPGTERPAGDKATEQDTQCTAVQCPTNHLVSGYKCYPCAAGYEQQTALLATVGNQACTQKPQCAQNYQVVNYQCQKCTPGYFSDPQWPYLGSTSCARKQCNVDQKVVNNQCTDCPSTWTTNGNRAWTDQDQDDCKAPAPPPAAPPVNPGGAGATIPVCPYTIIEQGKTFAVLDNTCYDTAYNQGFYGHSFDPRYPPGAKGMTQDGTELLMPVGWSLAPDNSISRAAAKRGPWGTDKVCLDKAGDGNYHCVPTQGSGSSEYADSGAVRGGALGTQGCCCTVGCDQGGYQTYSCASGRILIMKN